MANYNNGQYIDTAIKSVIVQTFTDWELIICDDASTDDSLAVIREFLHDKRIRLIKNEHRLGVIKVYKKLISNSQSNIAGILDSDDALTPDAIDEMYKAHKINPEAGFIDSQLDNCDENLNPISYSVTSSEHIKESVLFRRLISNFITFKIDIYYKSGGFDERIFAEDDNLAYKMEEIAPIIKVDKPLYMYRLLPNSLSHQSRRYMIMLRDIILAKYLAYNRRKGTNIINLPDHHMLLLIAGALEYCHELQEFNNGVVFALRAVRIAPFREVTWKMLFSSILKLIKPKSSNNRLVFPIYQFQCGTGNILEDRIICLPLRHNPGHCLFGADYMILTEGRYRLTFEMNIDESFNDTDSLVEIDCYENMVTKQVLSCASITKASINKSNLYTLEFSAYMRQRLEFRVWWHGQCRLQIKRVFLEFL
jgi:glycosyltransferase involved in cell wall biosynthesis